MIGLTPAETEALLLSLKISGAAVLLSLPIAVALAVALSQPRLPGRMVLNALVHLPLVLPPVVLGYLLLVSLGARAPLGAWLLETFDVRLVLVLVKS